MNYMRLKKVIAAAAVGMFAVSLPINADAKRIHDPQVATKSETRDFSESDMNIELPTNNAAAVENNLNNSSGSSSRVARKAVYVRGITTEEKKDPNFSSSIDTTRFRMSPVNQPVTESGISSPRYDVSDYSQAGDFSVPKTVSPYDPSISGTPMASQSQCVSYLLRHNPNPALNVSPEEIVAYYYEEGQREGIRPDVAFAQALVETGFFRYGGTVTPDQNNYCGLGTTSAYVKGVYFSHPQLGVRAHIQHLLAYSSTRKPTTAIVDPRYNVVRDAYGSRTLGNWQDLNGRWAVPGNTYGQQIISTFNAILNQ